MTYFHQRSREELDEMAKKILKLWNSGLDQGILIQRFSVRSSQLSAMLADARARGEYVRESPKSRAKLKAVLSG